MLFVWFEIKKAPGKLGSQGGKGFRSSPGAIGRFRESTSCRNEPILSVALSKSYQASLLDIRVKHPAHDPRKTSKLALLMQETSLGNASLDNRLSAPHRGHVVRVRR